jgi:hypothetical protein
MQYQPTNNNKWHLMLCELHLPTMHGKTNNSDPNIETHYLIHDLYNPTELYSDDLNDLDVKAADVGNAYLNAPTKERVYTTAGPEFGAELQGRLIIIVRALYGLKSSGAAWRNHLANTLHSMGFRSSLADPDVWLCPAVKVSGETYYEYIFVYVDDLLVLSEDPGKIMAVISQCYRLKNDSIQKPKTYLGAEIKEFLGCALLGGATTSRRSPSYRVQSSLWGPLGSLRGNLAIRFR